MVVYIVIACTHDEFYDIDAVYTSYRKAKKRCDELNKNGLEWLLDNRGCGLFCIETKIVQRSQTNKKG